jgi:23S rRNA (uracil1939-C5)-methyltransferase/tRNA (uracil-5-)-methyltransferase
MEPGRELTVEIDSVAFGGSGVARVDGLVVFVPFVLPGETVRVRVLKKHKQFAEAMPLAVVEPHPERIAPSCPYFGTCGGCAYQHVPYPVELDIKQGQVMEVFRRLAGETPPPVTAAVPSPLPYGYRTKIRMKFKSGRGAGRFGFFDHYRNALVDIDRCLLAAPPLNAYIERVRSDDFAFFREKRIRSYNLALLEGSGDVVDNLGENRDVRVSVEGARFVYNRNCFFQVNHSIFPALKRTLHSLFDAQGVTGRSMLDLYCGVGFFGILFSDRFERIGFIESNRTSFEYLLRNIEENGIVSRSETHFGPAEQGIAGLSIRPEVILMDPPRSGASAPSIRLAASLKPELIVYVSCNPATQFRDVSVFREAGYRLADLKSLDFFPQTKHIETIALFRPDTGFAGSPKP